MKWNRFLKGAAIAGVLITTLFVRNSGIAFASSGDNDSINEKYGPPVVVYGAQLSAAQKDEVKKLLDVTDPSQVREITATGQDLVNYIKGDAHANMYSSAKITRDDTGEGIVVNIVTPENITEVTKEMYANALLTAGVKDAEVDVASPIKVSGHSALVGIYKAYDTGKGTNLNKDRTEVASEELSLATNLAKKEGMDSDKVSQLLTEIKQEIAAQHPATKEDIANIVDEKLKTLNISLSEKDRQLLIDLFDKMRHLNINFDNVQSQLDNLAQDVKQKVQNAVDQGFFQKVADFFQKLIDAIKSIFS
ncbi:DUF1002 domain-containing protein [Bacillus salipaludis]|uniref:DUF1002 domain-containing protein n=1 Tax=Bacillus salipaludis TaxID=2547811 RepID=UPI003D206CD0